MATAPYPWFAVAGIRARQVIRWPNACGDAYTALQSPKRQTRHRSVTPRDGIVPARPETVELARDLYSRGVTRYTIAAHLEAHRLEHPTRSGRGHWTGQAVSEVLGLFDRAAYQRAYRRDRAGWRW
jgi:hypothetical protein